MNEEERARVTTADANARWDMLRDVWKAMYDEELPAMPISGMEAWDLLIKRIAVAREGFLVKGSPFPRLIQAETRQWR